MKRRPPPEDCPICGEEVPRSVQACPKCGACYESGWADVTADGLDLPEWAYEDDAEKVVRPRFRPRKPRSTATNPLWRWVALGLLVALFGYFYKWIYAALSARWF